MKLYNILQKRFLKKSNPTLIYQYTSDLIGDLEHTVQCTSNNI